MIIVAILFALILFNVQYLLYNYDSVFWGEGWGEKEAVWGLWIQVVCFGIIICTTDMTYQALSQHITSPPTYGGPGCAALTVYAVQQEFVHSNQR